MNMQIDKVKKTQKSLQAASSNAAPLIQKKINELNNIVGTDHVLTKMISGTEQSDATHHQTKTSNGFVDRLKQFNELSGAIHKALQLPAGTPDADIQKIFDAVPVVTPVSKAPALEEASVARAASPALTVDDVLLRKDSVAWDYNIGAVSAEFGRHPIPRHQVPVVHEEQDEQDDDNTVFEDAPGSDQSGSPVVNGHITADSQETPDAVVSTAKIPSLRGPVTPPVIEFTRAPVVVPVVSDPSAAQRKALEEDREQLYEQEEKLMQRYSAIGKEYARVAAEVTAEFLKECQEDVNRSPKKPLKQPEKDLARQKSELLQGQQDSLSAQLKEIKTQIQGIKKSCEDKNKEIAKLSLPIAEAVFGAAHDVYIKASLQCSDEYAKNLNKIQEYSRKSISLLEDMKALNFSQEVLYEIEQCEFRCAIMKNELGKEREKALQDPKNSRDLIMLLNDMSMRYHESFVAISDDAPKKFADASVAVEQEYQNKKEALELEITQMQGREKQKYEDESEYIRSVYQRALETYKEAADAAGIEVPELKLYYGGVEREHDVLQVDADVQHTGDVDDVT